MFNWLRSLFGQPEAPTQQGVYRSSRPKREPEQPRPVTETLFERPAPLPEATQVQVVAPTTEADRYRWLDYTEPQPAVEPVADTNPPPNPSGNPWEASGPWLTDTGNPVNISGSMLCLTGLSYDHFIPPICTGYIIPSCKPVPYVRRYGAITG